MSDLIERIDARLKGQVLPSRAMTIEIRDELTALRERVAELTEHIREQSEHCRVRIQDGIEMGAAVWRIALEDVMRENAAILAKQEARHADRT